MQFFQDRHSEAHSSNAVLVGIRVRIAQYMRSVAVVCITFVLVAVTSATVQIHRSGDRKWFRGRVSGVPTERERFFLLMLSEHDQQVTSKS